MRRIHKIKIKTVVKEIISDGTMEMMRDSCTEVRDLAMIDLLYSTGIRVGELVNLDISNVDLERHECIVYGKGDKERRVYFDAKAKIHLQSYLAGRKDANPALFVTLDVPHDRLKISGVEIRLRELGRNLGLSRIHSHKFCRTMATRAIDVVRRMMHMFPKIVQVVPTEEYTVYVYFEDGKIVCYDVKPLLGKEAFAILRDIEFFRKACTIMNDTLAWDISGNRDTTTCIDIDPDTLYALEAVKEKIA